MSQKGNEDNELQPHSHTGTTEETCSFYSFSLTCNPCHFHAMVLLVRDPTFTEGMIMILNVVYRTCYFMKKYLIE